MFYTALYHALLLPLNATDVNGEYPGFSHNPPLQDSEIHYRYFTPWDAFRTLHPLMNLVDPRKGTGEPVWRNQWSHFARVGDAVSIKVFYNGKFGNQLEHEGAIGHTDFEWRIGSNAEMPLDRMPYGIIDEVMIFAGALSEQEIAAIIEKMD